MMDKIIQLGHGSGGKQTHDLIKDIFVKHFDNPILRKQTDSALLAINESNIAFTTDSYVVDPIFFPGGNIGKLAICGTVNDLVVSGAIPKYISASFIIEEGLPLSHLEEIVVSMASEAKKANVLIVTGDTKVVNRKQCDKVFINTSGVGLLLAKNIHISSAENIAPGDAIIINGAIADHGMAIMASRNFGNFKTNIQSDCASLNHLIADLLNSNCRVKFMRDATRGGLATVLCELAEHKNVGIEIDETRVPVNENTLGMCELLGFDPFYVANEGKVVIVVDGNDAQAAVDILKHNPLGANSSIIGKVTDINKGKAILKTQIGGKRIIDMLAGEQLPRIC